MRLYNCLSIVKFRGSGTILDKDYMVIELLYQMGFIGFGNDTGVAPAGCEKYRLNFSYVRQQTKQLGKWDMCIISPIFYDFSDVNPDHLTLVLPHKTLLLKPKSVKAVRNYDAETNYYKI